MLPQTPAGVVGRQKTIEISAISITAIGQIDTAITRSGAQVGDSIYISSLPGWSAAGLSIIEKDLDGDIAVHAVSEFSAPTVDYSAAVQFSNGTATSMCDVCDALIIQAEQVALASGVHFAIDRELTAASAVTAPLELTKLRHNLCLRK